jgi:hypothetical protein
MHQLGKAKEGAAATDAFEMAAEIRDQQAHLGEIRAALIRLWSR